MKLEILTYPDPFLCEPARPVEEVTPELQQLIDNMVETMYADDGVGLAAPQVGQNIRLITLDQTGPKDRADLMVLINPEIVEASEEEVDSRESCLSCPGFTGTIKRNEQVTVRALDRDGKEVCIEADALLAIILQHEIDHLDGTLIVNRVGRIKRSMYDKRIKKAMKQAR